MIKKNENGERAERSWGPHTAHRMVLVVQVGVVHLVESDLRRSINE